MGRDGDDAQRIAHLADHRPGGAGNSVEDRKLVGPNFGLVEGADVILLTLTIDATGQVLWKNMQLTAEQLQIELHSFAATNPGNSLVVKCLADAPASAVALLHQAAARVSLVLALETR